MKSDSNLGLGKLPPQALELEEAVLGAIMLEKSAFNKVSDVLTKETFYKPAHLIIYDCMVQMAIKKESIDLLTLSAKLRSIGKLEEIGGAYYLTELTNRVASSANIGFHSRILHQKFLARELIRTSSEMLSKAYEDTSDVFELLELQQTQNFNLQKHSLGKSFFKASELLEERINHYQKPSINGLTGISTGLRDLDTLTGGWQKASLVIIAARPSMGKTAFVLNMVTDCALTENKAVGVFSLEMNKEELMDRIISSRATISSQTMKRKELSSQDYVKASKLSLQNLKNIIIDDTPGISIHQLRAKALRMKETDNIQMLAIDYLGLMRTGNKKNENRTNEIGEISRSLKGLAKELDIPVLLLSQLNRDVEKRPLKKPILSDLRDSGDVEQDADIVMFLYRPEYYGFQVDSEGCSTENVCKLLIEKHRGGVTDEIVCKVDFDKMQFYNSDHIIEGEDPF